MAKRWTMRPMVSAMLVAGLCAGAARADPPAVQRVAVERRAAGMFDRCDTNHDGVLTLAEYHAALAAIVKARGGTPTAKGWAMVDAQFATVDQSHSGRVTRAQFIDAALAHFDGADINHDGTVTPKEARTAAKIKNREAKKAKLQAAAPKP